MKNPLRFNRNFEKIAKVFDKSKIDIDVIDAYWWALKDLSDDDAEIAINLAIKKWKPEYGKTFPTPSELIMLLKDFKNNATMQQKLFASKKRIAEKEKSKHANEILTLLNKFNSGAITAQEFSELTKRLINDHG